MRELREADEGMYWETWACDAPDVGITYRVLRDEWDLDADPPERRILEIKIVA